MVADGNTTVVDFASKDVPLLQAFVAVAEAGSFTGAARRCGVDKSLLSRRVLALEESLGVRLLHRTTRKIHVTDAGVALHERVAAPLVDVLSALAAVAEPDELRGRLRVASIPAAAREVLVPAIQRLHVDSPNLEVEVRASEAMVDLVGLGIDVAIRFGRLADSSLTSRKLGRWGYVLCASPAWVQAHPEATTLEAIAKHWVLYTDVPRADQWPFRSGTETVELRVKPVLRVDDSATQLAAVEAGMGVSAFGSITVGDKLRSGELIRLLPQWRVETELGLYAVYPHRALLPRRVEAFVDAVAAVVREREPHWRAQTD